MQSLTSCCTPILPPPPPCLSCFKRKAKDDRQVQGGGGSNFYNFAGYRHPSHHPTGPVGDGGARCKGIRGLQGPHGGATAECTVREGRGLQENEIKGIHSGKEEIKLSLFIDDIILNIQNPREFTEKLLELINEFAGNRLQDQYTNISCICIQWQ